MQGWTEDSYGSHSVNTVQTCTAKSVRTSSTFALQSHKERPWGWHLTAGGGKPSLKVHSDSHDWSLSSVELPVQALSKGQVIQLPRGLISQQCTTGGITTAPPAASLLISSDRRDAVPRSQHNLSSSAWQFGIFYKEAQHILRAHAVKAGPRFFNFVQEVKRHTQKTTMTIIKETPLSETAIQLQLP